MLLEDKRTRPRHYIAVLFLLAAALSAIIPVLDDHDSGAAAYSGGYLSAWWFPSNPTWIASTVSSPSGVMRWTTNSLFALWPSRESDFHFRNGRICLGEKISWK